MRQKAKQHSNIRQLVLPIGVTEVPESALLSAYRRCRLVVPFEQALALPHLRICLRNVALGLGVQR